MEAFKRRRATELKNGRVAMLATMGYIVPEYFRFPGTEVFFVKLVLDPWPDFMRVKQVLKKNTSHQNSMQ